MQYKKKLIVFVVAKKQYYVNIISFEDRQVAWQVHKHDKTQLKHNTVSVRE